jgi:hypothetical protein
MVTWSHAANGIKLRDVLSWWKPAPRHRAPGVQPSVHEARDDFVPKWFHNGGPCHFPKNAKLRVKPSRLLENMGSLLLIFITALARILHGEPS